MDLCDSSESPSPWIAALQPAHGFWGESGDTSAVRDRLGPFAFSNAVAFWDIGPRKPSGGTFLFPVFIGFFAAASRQGKRAAESCPAAGESRGEKTPGETSGKKE
jgi:hypothetical protein